MELLTESRASFEAFKVSDNDRYGLFEEILKQMEDMVHEKRDMEDRLKDTEYSRANYRRDFENSRHELVALKASMVEQIFGGNMPMRNLADQHIQSRNAFVLVLVDGDAAPFKDEFIQKGTPGGESAARGLRQKVIQHVTKNTDVSPGFEVVIRVYSKMQGLNKTYQDAGVLDNANTFQDFVQGFNRVHPHCEYVNAGNDKEGADSKIQGTMMLFADNVHCKHIVLCASSDNSYTGFLRQYVPERESSKYITLVEAISFPQDLFELSQNFIRAEFEEVFRGSKILKRRVSFKEGASSQKTGSPATSYASKVSKMVNGGSEGLEAVEPSLTSVVDSTTRANGAPETPNNLTIKVNHLEQRIDDRLFNVKPDFVSSLQGRKLCNRHFLSHCNYNDCTHDHRGKLDPSELTALRFLARKTVCGIGSDCRDPHCVAAHMCIYGDRCKNMELCRYPPGMHGVSTDGAKYVPARSFSS